MEAMLERDGDRAATLMVAHLRATTRILTESGSVPPVTTAEGRASVAAGREVVLAP